MGAKLCPKIILEDIPPPKRRFDFLAERATPFSLPSARVKNVTSRSASRIGYVRSTIASDCFSGMGSCDPGTFQRTAEISPERA